MARDLLRFDAERPGHTWLILAGSFDAQKHGIPRQLAARSAAPVRAILPSSDTNFLRYDVLTSDAEYVWWVDEPPTPPRR